MGRALLHRSNEGSHYQNSLERDRDTEKDRERDNTHRGKEEGRERENRNTYERPSTHQHAHASHLHNCEDVVRTYRHKQYLIHTHERLMTHIASVV